MLVENWRISVSCQMHRSTKSILPSTSSSRSNSTASFDRAFHFPCTTAKLPLPVPLASPQSCAIITGHTHAVRSVAFSPDGTCIASASEDGTIRVWDLKSGEQIIKPLTGHNGAVMCVAFSPDGSCLASCSEDDTVRIYDLAMLHSKRLQRGVVHVMEQCGSSPSLPLTDKIAITPSSDPNSYQPSSCPVACPWSTHQCNVHRPHAPGDVNDVSCISSFHRSDYLDEDWDEGWIKGPEGELILWIPPEYRNYLVYDPLTSLIMASGAISLDLRRFVHGQDWMECYTGRTNSGK